MTSVPAPALMSLEDGLSKLRPLVSSKLSHQKKPALLLKALESSLPQPITPTAYYAALVQTIQQAVAKEVKAGELGVGEGDLIPAVLYLLAIVVDFVPAAVLHAQSEMGLLGPVFQTVDTSGGLLGADDSAAGQAKSVVSLFSPCATSAPSLRSLIAIVRQLLLSAPTPAFATSPYVAALNALLSLTLDPRPRVRKVAQEAVRDILASPPPPAVRHPYAERVAKSLIKILSERMTSEDAEQRRIWAVGFVRIVASSWPSDQITPLLAVLLPLPSHPFLQSTTLSLLSHLLSRSTSTHSLESHKIPVLLSEILSTPPKDQSVLPSWLEVVENGMISWAHDDPAGAEKEFGRVWGIVWAHLESVEGREKGVGKAAEKALAGMVRYCITEGMVFAAVAELSKAGSSSTAPVPTGKKNKKQIHQQNKPAADAPILTQIIATLQTALHVLRAIPYLSSTLTIVSALLSRLRVRVASASSSSAYDPRAPTAAQLLLLGCVADVGELRIQKGFELRERADEVLGMAVEVIGPEGVLSTLPLNIEPDRDASLPGRAFLLPILRAKTTNTTLAYFTNVFVPLSERLFNAKTLAERSRPIEGKVYEALVDQVWACLKGFCDLPVDLPKAFTNEFAALITQVLYTQPSLRPTLLRSLQTLVETSLTLSRSAAPPAELLASFGIDQTDGKKNLAFLGGMTSNLLAVLFNVFSQVAREQRGMVGEVITSYLAVSSEADVTATYEKVVGHLGEALQVPTPKPAPGAAAVSPTSHTMLDLLVIIVPFLPAPSARALFAHASAAEAKLIGSNDPAVQKKSYRILARLLETGKVTLAGAALESFVARLRDGTEVVSAGARRDRILLLAELVPSIPSDQLHLIADLTPEAVLGTKEVNEKTRDAAFELVVLMGQKMAAGGVIKRSQVEGIDADSEMADEVAASIPEYMTMIAAGLAGTTPHMISATITAISRLVFEYKDDIPADMKSDLVATLLVFLSSNNREIVKSALGFVKVIVVSFPSLEIQPHLGSLVPGLLNWSHDHKNHFKGKVRHIFERLIRKVSYDDVKLAAEEAAAQSEDAPTQGTPDGVKFLENIRKRKERSKKKKAAAREANGDAQRDDDDDDDDRAPVARTTTGNAFDDALYGSESDMTDSETEEATGAQRGDQRGVKGKGKGKAKDNKGPGSTFLREDGDEPLDLLDRTLAGRLSKNDPNAASRRRQPGQEASRFKTDADTGKMMIDDGKAGRDEQTAGGGPATDEQLAGMAYHEQLVSTEGQIRDAKGRVIFNKNTKRGRAREAEGGAMEVDEPGRPQKAKKQRQQKEAIGGEYRNKSAGGDVKKAGAPDPFAYIPLSQGKGSKKGGKSKVNITGKTKGRSQ